MAPQLGSQARMVVTRSRRGPRSPGDPELARRYRPPRRMIGMAFWYLATDQLRNDTFTADTFASSDGWARFVGLATAGLMAQPARMGCMPSYLTFSWNPLDRRMRWSGPGRSRARSLPGRWRPAASGSRPRTRVRRRTSRRR
jgi:hypothetical protein